MVRRLLLMLVLLVSSGGSAFADEQRAFSFSFSDPASGVSEGIYVPQDLVNPGVFIHQGVVARWVCIEMVEAGDGLSTIYARATVLNAQHVHVKIVGLAEGLSSAMAGVSAVGGSSRDHCGAEAVPTRSVTSLKVSLPVGV